MLLPEVFGSLDTTSFVQAKGDTSRNDPLSCLEKFLVNWDVIAYRMERMEMLMELAQSHPTGTIRLPAEER